MARRREVPISIYVFTAALAVVAAIAAVATNDIGFVAPDWVLFPLAGALVVAGMLQLEFHWGGEREAMDLFEAVLVPLIAVFAGPGAVLVTAACKAASQRLLGVPLVKAAFNTAQWAASAGVASYVYADLRGGVELDLAALGAALTAAIVINHVAVAVVIGLVRHEGAMAVVKALAAIVLPGWVIAGAMNICFGLLLAAVAVHVPELSVVFLVPLALFGWAQRAYSEIVVDRTRISALQQATHVLAADSDSVRALREALDAIRSAFAADTVAFVPSGAAGPRAHSGDGTGLEAAVAMAELGGSSSACRFRAGDGSAQGSILTASGRRTAMVATLSADGRTLGTLVSLDRGGLAGFDDGELAIFDALAKEVSGALRRWQLQAALVTERAHLFEIVDRSSDGIFTVGGDGAIVDWNPAMAAITGFSAVEATGGAPAALLRPSVGGSGEPMALERWKADGAPAAPMDLEIITRSGETRTLQCSFSETASEPTSLVVMARDVTKQRELDRLRDDFVATVSHELRTPLTTIVGFTSMLMEPPRPLTDAERDDAVAMVRKGARRLERLIYNLLEVSRIEHRDTAPPAPVDVRDAIHNSVAELRETYPLREIRIDAASGAVRAIGNQLSVEQILTNLLGNALKYSEGGPIEVTVHEAPDHLVIAVRDYGPGIPPSEQERIFERFHRVDQQHVQAGTGLGLYISRRLALSMGGDLTVDSAPGEGATFSLRLPAEVHLVAVG